MKRLKEILQLKKTETRKTLKLIKTWWKTALKEKDTRSYYQKMITELGQRKDDSLAWMKYKDEERLKQVLSNEKI